LQNYCNFKKKIKMKNRRKFLKNSLIAAGAVAFSGPLMAVTPGNMVEKINRFPGVI